MKKMLFATLAILAGLVTVAQEKTNQISNQKWKIRLRAIAAVPPSSSYDLAGSDIKISTSVVPEVDFTYHFSKHLAAELILGTTRHTVKVKGSSASTTLGKVWLLPPTLNLQYHFASGKFDPYIGAGINYTIFYGVKDDAASLKYKSNVGFSTQLGFDYDLSKKWFLNVDIKKIFLKTDVTVKGNPETVLKK